MMDVGFDFSIIWSLLGAFISFLTFGACVYFIIVKPCLESILLTVGSFINLIAALFYSLGVTILSKFYGIDFLSSGGIFAVMGIISFIGSICFTSGLIVLIVNHIRIVKKMKLEKY
jgi:hypothetical protein